MHIAFTIYSIITTILYTSIIDNLSAFTLIVFILMHQYVYIVLRLKPVRQKPMQFCDRCECMTQQSYVHCKECKECVPVTFTHSHTLKICAEKDQLTRYTLIGNIIMGVFTLLALIASIQYSSHIGSLFYLTCLFHLCVAYYYNRPQVTTRFVSI
jgi:hypothetical protein